MLHTRSLAALATSAALALSAVPATAIAANHHPSHHPTKYCVKYKHYKKHGKRYVRCVKYRYHHHR